jgi:hypothetical protein
MQFSNLLHLILDRMRSQVILIVTIHQLRNRTENQPEILPLPLILVFVLVLLRLVLLYLLMQQNLITVSFLYQFIIGLLQLIVEINLLLQFNIQLVFTYS